MKRFIILTIEIIICFLLQTTVFQWFSLANVVPNLLLVVTVSSAFMHGQKEGLLVGFFSGLLVDFCFGNVIGMYAFIYMFVGYINGYSNKIFDMDDMTVPIILIGVSEFIYFFLYYILEFLLRGKLNIFFYFTRIGLPEIIYTVFISIFLYKLLLYINEHMIHIEEEEVY